MKYIANPVEVDAFKIDQVSPASKFKGGVFKAGDVIEPAVPDGFILMLENKNIVHANKEICGRMTPMAGDYWMIRPDGFASVCPCATFERNYHPAE
jgi:hypothetical protein